MDQMREPQTHLRDYLRVLIKHRWAVLTPLLVVFLGTAGRDFSATPLYRASVRVIIEKDAPELFPLQTGMRFATYDPEFYETQYKIITSRAVARKVIKVLNLDQHPEFTGSVEPGPISDLTRTLFKTFGGWKDGFLSLLRGGEKVAEKKDQATIEDFAPDAALVSNFVSRVKVTPIRDSKLVDVGFDATDAVLAARIANALGQAYIDNNLENRVDAIKNAVNWLNNRIEEERKRVEGAEQSLLEYKEQQGIVTDFSSNAETITAQKLAQLNEQVVAAEARRVEAETKYRQAQSLKNSPVIADSIPEVLNNPLIQEIKSAEVLLYKTISELSKKYGPSHPKMKGAQSELGALQSRKNIEVQRVIDSLKNEYQVALAREESLKSALAQQKQESLDLNQKAIEYGVLKRETDSANAMYEVLIKRFKETSVAQDLDTSNIRIIDKAEVPGFPVWPNTRRDLLLALVIGLLLGVGLAFFLEYLDNTIKTPEDIEDFLEVPHMGLVPSIVDRIETAAKEEDGPLAPIMVTAHDGNSVASEAYRAIRTKIMFSAAEKPPQVIVVSSSLPQEGKTVTCANLAVVMAQAGTKVMLLDCDMRRPRLHRLVGIERDKGISNVLVGEIDLQAAIVETVVPNLHLIPCGPVPPNPAELLGSNTMAKIIEELRLQYSHVLIDTPPISAVTDAVVVGRLADGVLMVIRANETARELARNGLNQFIAVNAHVLGAVLNDVDMERDGYYYRYYYYYDYYYAEDGQRRKKR